MKSEPVDPLDRATLRRLLAEATPGPWIADFEHEPVVLLDDNEPGRCVVATCEQPQAEYDAELIAVLRNSASALLDRLEQVEQALEQERAALRRIEHAPFHGKNVRPRGPYILLDDAFPKMRALREALAARPVPPTSEGEK